MSIFVNGVDSIEPAVEADILAAHATTDGKIDALDSVVDAGFAAGALDATVAKEASLAPLALEATSQSILTDTAEIGAAGAGLTAITGAMALDSTVAKEASLAALATSSDLADVASDVIGIQTDLDNGTDGLGALKVLIDGVQSTVSSIQNNTRMTASIPAVIVPSTGSQAFKVIFNLYDSGGATEDPDSDIMAVTLSQTDGTDVSSRLYKQAALTDVLDTQSGGTFDGLKKLVKDSTGRYVAFYKSVSTDITEALNFRVQYEEGTVGMNADRAMNVSVTGSIDANVAAIKAVTDELPDAGALTSLAQDATVAKEASLASLALEATAQSILTDTAEIGAAGAGLTAITGAMALDSTVAKEASLASLALEATAQSILTDTAEIGAAGAGLTAITGAMALDSTVAKEASLASLALEATAQSILTDTAEIGAAGAGLTAITGTMALDSTVAKEASLATLALEASVQDVLALDGSTFTAIPFPANVAGVAQVIKVPITCASNAAPVTIATATNKACVVKSIVLHNVSGANADLTSCNIKGGGSSVVTFLSDVAGVKANLDAADKQIAWTGAVRIPVSGTITFDPTGTDATALNMVAMIEYFAEESTGYLA